MLLYVDVMKHGCQYTILFKSIRRIFIVLLQNDIGIKSVVKNTKINIYTLTILCFVVLMSVRNRTALENKYFF